MAIFSAYLFPDIGSTEGPLKTEITTKIAIAPIFFSRPDAEHPQTAYQRYSMATSYLLPELHFSDFSRCLLVILFGR